MHFLNPHLAPSAGSGPQRPLKTVLLRLSQKDPQGEEGVNAGATGQL